MREQDERPYPVKEDMRVQRSLWAAERTAWALWALLIVATLAGFASKGPASEASVTAPNALTVDYERFQRLTRLARFTLRVPDASAGEVTLRLDPQFVQRYEIEAIQPHPASARGGDKAFELAFAPANDSGLVVQIDARPRTWGSARLQVARDADPPVGFRVFVYP
jgi:hypothetical protein